MHITYGRDLMDGKKKWERKIRCDSWSDAVINLHITKSDTKKIRRAGDEIHYIINPNRIGIDFDNFSNGSQSFIPNMNPSDVIQIINRLEILTHDYFRKTLRKGTIPYKLGVELDSRRKLDFDVGYSSISGNEEVLMYYEDSLRGIDRFEIGRIDIPCLSVLIKALKEAFIEYINLMNRALILKEII